MAAWRPVIDVLECAVLRRRRQTGLTLLEALLWLGFLSMTAVYMIEWRNALYFEQVVKKTVDGFVQFDEAAYSYYLENGVWPEDLADLADLIPLLQNVDTETGTAGRNGVGLPYSGAIDIPSGGFVLATTMESLQQALAVSTQFPSASYDDTTFVVSVGLVEPGT